MKITTHPENISTYKKYIEVVSSIEAYLKDKGYLKLDLPVLSPALIPESYLEVFETEFRYFDIKEKLYLTPSPELFIKRLLAAGIGDCYYMNKSFRNSEPHSPKHEPEFIMLELYKVGEDYKYMAQEVLNMLQYIAKSRQIVYQGKAISLEKWEEFTIAEVFKKYADISEEELFDHTLFLAKAKEKGYVVDGFTYEDLWSQIYTQEIDSHLGTNGYPTVLFDYPVEFAALSKPNLDGRTSQRFEFYIQGVELGNCYSELTDWKLQEERFGNEYEERKKSGKIDHPVDWGFIEALKQGLPESTGIAIGVERLAMIFADVSNLADLKLITLE
ncbi:elongation factor P--(R)-beta-lysine ligase [soil metagenome]